MPDPSVAHIVQDSCEDVLCAGCNKPTGKKTTYLLALGSATQFGCVNCGEVYIYVLASRRALAEPATTIRSIHSFNLNRKVKVRLKGISYNDTDSLEGFTF